MSHDHHHDEAHLREVIRKAGLRATKGRISVLRVLHGSDGPASHADVIEWLADEGWDRATLYRNLVDLTEVGLLRKITVGDQVWRFELAEADEHADEAHPHFLCTQCGGISCLPELSLSAVGKLPQSVTTGEVSIQLRGVCDTCIEVA